MPPDPAPRLYGLPPILGDKPAPQLLILGSFPSAASLAAQAYYAHPRNLFWRLLGDILHQPLPTLPYPERLPIVQAHGIAIWDVFASCLRDGSLDSAIQAQQLNDFSAFKNSALAGRLRRICFNGRLAAQTQNHLQDQLTSLGMAVDMCVLPSTSPANAGMSYARKLELWQQGLLPVLDAEGGEST